MRTLRKQQTNPSEDISLQATYSPGNKGSAASTGTISGFPYFANISLKASATRPCNVVSSSMARSLIWSRTCLGKCTVMGHVAPLHARSVVACFALNGAARSLLFPSRGRAHPKVSASSSVRFALVLMLVLLGFGFVFQLDENAQSILVDL